ncbi:MAG: hypothetical protein ACREIP_19740, partial [Alphaproteobacteria bacterium]
LGLALPQIQDGIDFVRAGGTVNVAAGFVYTGSLTITKSLNLLGNPSTLPVPFLPSAQHPYPAEQPGAASNAPEIVATSGAAISVADPNSPVQVVIRGFKITGNSNAAIDAFYSGGGNDPIAGSFIDISRNTITGGSPVMVRVHRFESVNVDYNLVRFANNKVFEISTAVDVNIRRNAVMASEQPATGNDDIAFHLKDIRGTVNFLVNIIDGSYPGLQNGQPGLADGLVLTSSNATVYILNNYFSGLGNDAIRFESGDYIASIHQNFIGAGVRTDLLTVLNEFSPRNLVGNRGDGIQLMANAAGTFNIRENFIAGNATGPGAGSPFNLSIDISAGHPKTINESQNWYGTGNPINGVHYNWPGGAVTNPLQSG